MKCWNSRLYECAVSHRRLAPRPHQFEYRVFMFYLDLDELDAIASSLRLFGRNRFNLFAFRDSDHFPFYPGSIRENIQAYASRSGLAGRLGRVMLLTYVRTCGYIFNPVSFYFCFDPSGRPVCAIPEVGNTFAEQKPYFIGRENLVEPDCFVRRMPKHFYVSPFVGLNADFEFRLRVPADRLDLAVDDWTGGKKILVTSLTGNARPLGDAALLDCFVRYPLITLKVITAIHWNALLLYLKKVPHHAKASDMDLQKDIHRRRKISPGRSAP